MPSQKHVLIIGGGIAGPVLALFLKKAGIASTVFEAYPERRETGGALGLAPNGVGVLAELGLAKEVIAGGTVFAAMEFRRPDGRRIGIASNGTYDQPAVTLSRARLHQITLAAAKRQGIAIRYGKRLRDIEETASEVIARFEDGSEARGSVIVGADGINSRLREIVIADGPKPEFTGLVGPGGFVPRSVIPMASPEDEQRMVLYYGPGVFVGYGLGDRSDPDGAFWWTALERDAPLGDGERAAMTLKAVRAEVLARSERWDERLLSIIDATTSFVPPLNLFDVASLPRWSKGRAVLIGDAAHAVSPHSGQGASLALEDAICLARQLRDKPDHAEAFADFEAERRERAEKIVAFGRRSGNSKKKQGAVATALQAALMPIVIRMMGRMQRWMFAYRVRWEDTTIARKKAA